MASLKMNTAFTPPPHVDEVAIFAPYKYSQNFHSVRHCGEKQKCFLL